MKILEILTHRRIVGNIGERAAKKFLKRSGYKILKSNYVAVGYEIDIIAADREHTVFCEVKTRTVGHESLKEPRPACAVTPDKQRDIISAAKIYEAFRRREGKKFRFDVAEVYLYQDKKVKKIEYIEGAFNMNTPFQKQH